MNCLRHLSLSLSLSLLLAVRLTAAGLQLGSPFGDHMVLQQARPVPVWGQASAGATVTVAFAGQQKSTLAHASGDWSVMLAPLSASAEPRSLTVTATPANGEPPQSLTVGDVLVGEVWLCGGQSNMERQLGPRPGQKDIVNWEATTAAATNPLIRQLSVKQTRATAPQSRVEAAWTVCSPETVVDFTAVGYFFARDLQARLGVPVGIIHSSWGGTPAESWTSREALKPFPEFNEAIATMEEQAANAAQAARTYSEKLNRWFAQHDPASAAATPWQDPAFAPADWETMTLPASWESAGHEGFDGIVWFRREVDLPPAWAGRDLILRLGAIDDIDTTWVNGTEVGTTTGWTTERTYRIPAAALRPGRNVIAVRVLDTGGDGGLWNPRTPPSLAPADDSAPTLSLSGPWLAKFSTPLTSQMRPPQDPRQSPYGPVVLYNGMIAPLVPYALRGVAFYQGEANAGRATQYRRLLPAMIADWRTRWGQGDFPFVFVQIAPHKAMGPEIREAQLQVAQAVPNTALAVTLDVGDAEDIHPANKEPVGARLALAARALAYGDQIEYSGPVFERLTLDGARAILSFTRLAGGLVAPGGKLEGFTIAGADGVFQPADAVIAGATVVVSSPAVPAPAAVRYGWAHVPRGNLFNRAGLPASPFRTDAP